MNAGRQARSGRRPAGLLFAALAACFAGLAAYAAVGSTWIIVAAAGVLAVWMAELAYRTLR